MSKRNRILLINGCSISQPSVFPKNWKSAGVDLLDTDWRIQYYFRDPDFAKKYPKGKLCVVKGMNEFKTLSERRAITNSILDDEVEELKNGWNPITKSYMIDHRLQDGKLHPELPFVDAFKIAMERLDVTDRHRNEVRLIIERIDTAAKKLKMRSVPISILKRRDLKRVLLYLDLPPKYFNKAKAYVSSLFVELIEDECCDVNLTRDIRKQKTVKKVREIMSVDQYRIVMAFLKSEHYEFWRYAQIFLYSGARTSELTALKFSNVDLKHQEFTVTIKKGNRSKEVTKVILPEVLHLWEEVCDDALKNDYIFSKGLIPGADMIRHDQITKRWYRLVKKSDKIIGKDGLPLKVYADFYSLKHTMLDSLPTEMARKLASHTNSRTTAIYQVNQDKRDREELKKLRIVV